MKGRECIIFAGIIAIFALVFTSCEQPTSGSRKVAVTGVTLNKDTLTLPIGRGELLTATVLPEDAANKAVNWTSSDPDIATVDESGRVEAQALGSASITVTTVDGNKTAECTVTVIPIPVEDIVGVQTMITVGNPQKLNGTVIPSNAANQDIVWSVNDAGTTGATIDENAALSITAEGTVIVTARIVDGKAPGEDFTKDFTITVYPSGTGIVTNNADSGEGSLRYALSATGGDRIIIAPGIGTIALSGPLSITRDVIIEGNGITLTPGSGWTESTSSQLMVVDRTVTINRVWFKDGRAMTNGAAINNRGTLTLESCIFSGNRTSNESANGGAIANSGSVTLIVKGCTFYGNSAGYSGGAVYNNGSTLTLTGNLFYGNTAGNSGSVVYNTNGGTVTSGGYNVVDAAFGTGAAQSGWTADANDKHIIGRSISPVSFKLLSASGAANVINTLPAGYPAFDFYGDAITASAAAGAVQSAVSSSGYALDVSVDDSSHGSVNVTPALDADGLVGGPVTITAIPASGYSLLYWLKDGVNFGDTNPLNLTLTAHTTVKAVFVKIFIVNNFSDTSGSETIAGTLRHALTNAQNGDIIRLSGVTSRTTTIALSGRLEIKAKDITIEGNGITLTPGSGWTESESSQLMVVNGTATISRVYFKDGRATTNGAAIQNNGTLTLESCIFSGNRTSANGGAISNDNSGTLIVKGCTFYGNSAGFGGAVYNRLSTLNLTGNLFYGNTASSSGRIVFNGNNVTITSGGYNVVDVDLGSGTNQSGWTPASTDKRISDQPVAPVSFKLLSAGGAANVINTLPAGYPAFDFYGAAINAPAATGAVQGTINGLGYLLDLSVNDRTRGSIGATPAPNDDGLYSGTVTITASEASGYIFAYWLKDGANAGNANPLNVTLTAHTAVQAIFTKGYTVNNFSDGSGSASTEGTLRHAIINAQDGDSIILDGVTAGTKTIELTSPLPDIKGVTIVGNGITLTPGSGWTPHELNAFPMVSVSSGTVTISRVWFKDGRAADQGAAIHKSGGDLTLESCIFSGNKTSEDSSSGGAIYNSGGNLSVKGCTFSDNSTGLYGGAAIRNATSGGTITITGNVFYENTGGSDTNTRSAVVFSPATTVISSGYNVVDMALGTGGTQSSGWTAGTGDLFRSTSPFSSTITLAPASELSVIPSSFAANMPTTDFSGTTRTYPGAPGAVK
jgi:hypothetical protein